SVLPKRESLRSLIDTTECNLVVLTETWLNSSICDTELSSSFPNFDIFRRDRANKRGGGVLIAAHRNLQCVAISTPSPLEIVFISCNASYPPIIIGACYRPPDADYFLLLIFMKPFAG
ncbi:unnamed protein product, partial [Ixodes hexagonus]